MKNLVVLFVLTLTTIFCTACSKPESDADADAVAAKAKFDATYNHDKIMKLGGAEAEAERLKKFQ